jgi:hypothetical protein
MFEIKFISQIWNNSIQIDWYHPFPKRAPKYYIYASYEAFHKKLKPGTELLTVNQFWQQMNGKICEPSGRGARDRFGTDHKNNSSIPYIIFFPKEEIINNFSSKSEKNIEAQSAALHTEKLKLNKHHESQKLEIYSNGELQISNNSSVIDNITQLELASNYDNTRLNEIEIDTSNSNKSKNSKNLNIDLDDSNDIDENETDSTSSRRPNPIPLISQQDILPPINLQNNHRSLLEQEENGVNNQILNDIDRLLDEIYELLTKSNEVIEGMCKEHLQSIKNFLEGLLVKKIYFNNPFNCYYSNLEQIEILATQIYELSLNLETHKQFNLATCKDQLLAVKEFLEASAKNINQEQKGENFELYESICVDEALRAKMGKPPQSEKLQENQQKQHLRIEEQQENFVNSQNMTNNKEKEWDIKFLDHLSSDTVNNKQCSKQKKNLNFYIIRHNEKKIQIPRRTLNTLRKLNEKYVQMSLILFFKDAP